MLREEIEARDSRRDVEDRGCQDGNSEDDAANTVDLFLAGAGCDFWFFWLLEWLRYLIICRYCSFLSSKGLSHGMCRA